MPDPPNEEPTAVRLMPSAEGDARGAGTIDLRDGAVLFVAGALLLGLSLYQLGEHSFWRDEIASVVFARAPLAELTKIVDRTRSEAGLANMASYYLLLHFWLRVAEGEAQIRLLSVLFGVAAIVPTYFVARHVAGRWAAAGAGLLFGASPTVVDWNQQARGYSLAMLVCAVLTLLVIHAVERRAWYLWLAYGLVAAFGIYVHFFVTLIVAAHAGWVLVTRSWGSWRSMAAVAVPILLAAAPLPLIVLRYGAGHGWIEGLTPALAVESLTSLAGSPLLLVLLTVLGALAIRELRHRRGLWLVAATALIPLLGIAALSTVKPFFIARYLVIATPGVAMLSGAGLGVMRPPALRAVLGIAVVAATLLALPTTYADSRQEDWRSAASWVSTNARAGDRIYMQGWSVRPMTFYLARSDEAPVPRIRLEEALSHPPARLWIVLPDPGMPDAARVQGRLERRYEIVDEQEFGTKVRLLLAEPLPLPEGDAP